MLGADAADGVRRSRTGAELEREHSQLDLGLVDAAVLALCERLAETTVATLDRRDFSAVRPSATAEIAVPLRRMPQPRLG